jgi:hypothetical protein
MWIWGGQVELQACAPVRGGHPILRLPVGLQPVLQLVRLSRRAELGRDDGEQAVGGGPGGGGCRGTAQLRRRGAPRAFLPAQSGPAGPSQGDAHHDQGQPSLPHLRQGAAMVQVGGRRLSD